MKKYFILATVLLISFQLYAQQGKKTEKEKPPTQKEMEDMMKQAQGMIDQMSPEDKKMMDSMGIKMPSFNNVPQVGDKKLAEAYENENRIVPKKDAARIGSIPSAPLNTATMNAYIAALQNKVAAVLEPASKKLGDDLYAACKTKYGTKSIGNIAAGLWMAGRNEPAIYLMGKACADDPSGTDNLNNYAAMLSMNNGEQLAIPLLDFLNSRYPKNSTILNNLGQAWFGLGELDKADKYFDSTLKLFPGHPQAAVSKAAIEESKGSKDQAAELIRQAIRNGYTDEKAARLRKLGGKLKGSELRLPPKVRGDYLGLDRFEHPDFPKSVDESITLEPVWKAFRENAEAEVQKLKKQLEAAKKIAEQAQTARINKDLGTVKNSLAMGRMQGAINPVPLYIIPAQEKLTELADPKTGLQKRINELQQQFVAFAQGDGLKLKTAYRKTIEKLDKIEDDQTGEGLANKSYCPEKKAASDQFLSSYNGALQKMVDENLALYKQQYNEMAYLYEYAQWEEDYAVTLLTLKANWLGAISECGPFPFESITIYRCAQPKRGKDGKLSEFDDVACQYHSTLSLGPMTIQSDCSRETTTLDAGFIKMGLKQDMDQKTFEDQFMSCTVEVKASAGAHANVGPVQVGIGAEAGVGVEIDRSGVKDVYIIGAVDAGAAGVKAGVEGQISLISGASSMSGTGIFSKK
ncbi:MAG: hypothetical protein JST86_16690 [Bacteroidetes bacterium]|nr:hypothetical protein [Bacteroidota bacterium]